MHGLGKIVRFYTKNSDSPREMTKKGRMKEVQEQMTAKRILYRKKDSSWFGSDYNVNLYQGCPHGCIYCDSRSECYAVEHFSQVRAKRDALDLLQKQLASCRKGGVVATGSMSDPYNPLEEKQRLTRGMLTLLLRHSFGVSIATKSSLVERDIDLLEQIKGYAPALVKLTITTPHDHLAEQLEPNAGTSARTGSFCRRAADAGPSLFGGQSEGHSSTGRAVCAGRSKIYLPLFWSDPAGSAAGIFFGVPGEKQTGCSEKISGVG